MLTLPCADADKPAIRTSALELYARLRRTSGILPPTASYRERQTLTPIYDAPTSIAFLSGLMPSIYAATLNALTMTRDRLKIFSDWEPDRIVDYGSGTGSAAWAVEEVWGPQTAKGEAREYIGLDASRDMIEVSSGILGALAQKRIFLQSGSEANAPTRMSAKAYQVDIPTSATTLAKLQLAPASYDLQTGKRTMALAAFSLGDETSREKRKELVKEMWESGAEVIAIIERGTPGGSRMVIEAREQLLMYGKRQISEEVATPGLKGSFVVAPVRSLPDLCEVHSDIVSW